MQKHLFELLRTIRRVWTRRILNFEFLTGVASPLRPLLPVNAEIPPPPPVVEMVDLPPALADLASWAVALFAEAELELPPVRFRYHEGSMEPCHGRTGSHTRSSGGSTIDICTSEVTGVTEVLLLHEAAHAWAAHALDGDRQAAFKALRGFEHWRDYEAAAWHENGTEQAAEFIVWGLLDRPYSMIRIYHSGCDELERGFEILTGRPPLHGFVDRCAR